MSTSFSDSDLDAYLEEALPAETMAAIEQALRDDEGLRQRLLETIRRRDQGAHTVGAIWRRHRLSCLSREQLGSYLLGALEEGMNDYVEFHLQTVGCRYCQASLVDLQRRQAESRGSRKARRRRYFESSAGHLRQS